MDAPWFRVPDSGRESAEPGEDLTADLLRLAAALVTLLAAIVIGVVR